MIMNKNLKPTGYLKIIGSILKDAIQIGFKKGSVRIAHDQIEEMKEMMERMNR